MEIPNVANPQLQGDYRHNNIFFFVANANWKF